MTAWDQLAVGARWPCGHAKTPENTQTGYRNNARCKECHRARGRDYWERKRNMAIERMSEIKPDHRAEELGGEFVTAKHRWAMQNAQITRSKRKE